MNILVTTTNFGQGDNRVFDTLKEKNCHVRLNPFKRKLSNEEIQNLIVDVDGLIAGTEPITREVLDVARRLKVISRCGTGLDNIDMEAASQRGVKVYRTPEGPALAVAELTLGFMLDALRYNSLMGRKICKGLWEKKMGNLLTGRMVGVIGMGHIGKKLVELLMPFRCQVRAFDEQIDDSFAELNNLIYLPLEDILRVSDIVTVHLPLTTATRGLFGKDKFSLIKKGGIFINTSRGEIVDEDALYEALHQNIRYACLDVFTNEPYTGRLRELENVSLTCHAGAYAIEARNMMEMEAVKNLLRGLEIE